MSVRDCYLVALCFAAISCAKVSVVGTSGEPDAAQAPAGTVSGPPHDPPKVMSTLTAPADMALGFDQPILGDVDGDGLDDFLVLGTNRFQAIAGGPIERTEAYLFYGKPQFSPNISTLEADAVFEADAVGVWGLGDINGDGLADFSVGQVDGFDLVFGNASRYSGRYPAHAVGTSLTAPPLGPPVAITMPVMAAVRGAGDVDHDGIADLLITHTAFEPRSDIESSLGFGLLHTDYLVLGHRGEWPSGAWDESSAVASFGVEQASDANGRQHRRLLTTLVSGDLDGDGSADVLAHGASALYVFYGGSERLIGTLDPSRADASFPDPAPSNGLFVPGGTASTLFAIGDLDGDGASDLALFNGGHQLAITYGDKARWSGSAQLTPDYVIDFDPRVLALAAVAAGDIDSDGAPELVLMAQGERPVSPDQPNEVTADNTLYIVRGSATRATGHYHASSSDIYRLPSEDEPTLPVGPSFTSSPYDAAVLSMAGDVDGDGSCDILTGHVGEGQGSAFPRPEVYLIPSTPLDPD